MAKVIDYNTPSAIFGEVPRDQQVHAGALTPLTYSREAALQVPIVKLDILADTVTVNTLFASAMEAAEGSFSKKDLKNLMEVACALPVGVEETRYLQLVAPNAVERPLVHPGYRVTRSRAAVTGLQTVDLNMEEAEIDAPPQAAESESTLSIATAQSYIACALMRLCVKSPASFLNGVPHLKNAYVNLMRSTSEFLYSFRITPTMCHNIFEMFSTSEDLVATLAHHAAMADEATNTSRTAHGPLRFLILQHLDLNGMAAYSLYLECKRAFQALEPRLILTWLNDVKVRETLRVIAYINTNHDRENLPDRVWRYSRLINPSFFHLMKQSECFGAIARMACLLVKSGAINVTSWGDPRRIKCLEGKAELLAKAERFAVLFIDAYESVTVAEDDAGPIAREMAEKGPIARRIRKEAQPAPPVVVTVEGGADPELDAALARLQNMES